MNGAEFSLLGKIVPTVKLLLTHILYCCRVLSCLCCVWPALHRGETRGVFTAKLTRHWAIMFQKICCPISHALFALCMHRAVPETLHSGALIANCRQGHIIVYLYERTKIVTCVLASFRGKCVFYTKKKKKRLKEKWHHLQFPNISKFIPWFHDKCHQKTLNWSLAFDSSTSVSGGTACTCELQRTACILFATSQTRQVCVHSVRFKVRPLRIPAVCLLRLTGECQGVEERHEELRG